MLGRHWIMTEILKILGEQGLVLCLHLYCEKNTRKLSQISSGLWFCGMDLRGALRGSQSDPCESPKLARICQAWLSLPIVLHCIPRVKYQDSNKTIFICLTIFQHKSLNMDFKPEFSNIIYKKFTVVESCDIYC